MTIQTEETKISVITKSKLNKRGFRINLRVLNKTLFVMIIMAGFLYIAGANELTVMGFKIREMKKQVTVINNENQDLETKITSISSYSDLGEKVKKLGMIKAERMKYVDSQETFVAKK